MNKVFAAIWAEYMKIRRSKIFFITLTVFSFIPMMVGLMMFVSKNPEIASKLGIIGTKSKMFSENDWKGYFELLNQVIASIGLLGFGFVTSWVFGREHTDRTMKDILALPLDRNFIVLAKFVITFFWCIILTAVTYSVGLLIGQVVSIPGWSASLFTGFSKTFFISGILTFFLCSPVAYLAGYSRGIIAPLGFVLLTMIFAQFAGLLGLGPYFPWAIPGLYSVNKDDPGFILRLSSYIILTITFIAGYWATIYWWKNADHH
ncbi:MAG TPA: ABC transporter permease [Bacteroidales bacterium]|nr:ABC transporter permease [Bacteroidales bacterium]